MLVMTFRDKQKQNKQLIKNYDAFLQQHSSTYDTRSKLFDEISRLQKQNRRIDNMLHKDTLNDCGDYTITQNSKLNENTDTIRLRTA